MQLLLLLHQSFKELSNYVSKIIFSHSCFLGPSTPCWYGKQYSTAERYYIVHFTIRTRRTRHTLHYRYCWDTLSHWDHMVRHTDDPLRGWRWKTKKSSIYDYLFGTLSDYRMTGIFRGERSLIRTIITSMYLRILSSFSLLFVMVQDSFAKIGIGDQPANSILKNASGWTFYDFLAFIEWFLLKVVLPIVIVGAFLYVSYKLFLAEGNEEENKKAWKAVTYASIWIISIMIAYALIAIVSRVSI